MGCWDIFCFICGNINNKTKSIFLNNYELIGIYDDIITKKILLS